MDEQRYFSKPNLAITIKWFGIGHTESAKLLNACRLAMTRLLHQQLEQW